MNQITPALAERGRVCSYDRANLGQSGPAPTPRTARDIVDDLHALLRAAAVPGPYLLIGHSEGGPYVQLYPRVYPTEVAGVLITNPVPPCAEWMEKGFRAMSAAEQADERAYFGGENPETVDWCESSEQISSLPAPSMPVEVLISTVAQVQVRIRHPRPNVSGLYPDHARSRCDGRPATSRRLSPFIPCRGSAGGVRGSR